MKKLIALTVAGATLFGGGTVALAQSGEIQGLMDTLLASARSTYVPNGYAPTRQPRVDFLSQGDSKSYPLQLNAGRDYVFVGVCDADCSDLDLILNGANGVRLAADVLVDDTPVVRFRATRTMRASLDVSMASCSTGICYYQVGTFAPR